MLTDRSRIARSLCSTLAIATALVVSAGTAHAQTAPSGSFQGNGTFASGSGTITTGAGTTTINIATSDAVIDWTTFDAAIGGGPINFQPSGTTATFQRTSDFSVLNRILPTDPSRAIQFNGNVIAQIQGTTTTPGGTVYFYSPGGVIVGSTAVFNVGNLGLTSIAPAVVGGVFEQPGTAGAKFVQFNGAVTASSAVRVLAGAQINGASPTNSYVALVAPVVDQRGTINVNGQAALVSADAVTMTFRNSGLFDIQVTLGTSGNVGGPNSTLFNSGQITGPVSSGAGDNHRVYMVAVPKNTAITLGIAASSQLGFNIAGAADVVGNAVVLSAGKDIVGGNIATSRSAGGGTGAADLNIANTAVTSSLRGASTDETFFFSIGGGTASTASTVNLQADTRATYTADGAGSVTTGNGTVTLNSEITGNGVTGGQTDIFAINGGQLTITNGGATLTSRGFGTSSGSPGVAGGNVTGGRATIQASTGGDVAITGPVNVFAGGFGGAGGSGAAGGSGTGGLAQIFAGDAGSSITITGATAINALGVGGVGTNSSGGVGTGGTATVQAIGSLINLTNLSVDARGLGGAAGTAGGNGGSGTGGFAALSALPGGDVRLSGTADLSATGSGGMAQANGSSGGAGRGGTTRLLVQSTAAMSVASDVSLDASGSGGFAAGVGVAGGAGIGGVAQVVLANGTQAGAPTSTTVTVPGTANPFLAGQPNGATALGDTAPAQSPTLALSNFDPSKPITISAAGGFNFGGGTPAASADGDGGLGSMNAGVNGISGPQNIMFNSLVGVFIANTVPSGTVPAQRNDPLNYSSVSPSLQQIFSVGDGLTGTGTGTQQSINAPSGATRFYLGAADGSGWFNNSGTSTVTINYTSLSTTLTGLATLSIGGALTANAIGMGGAGNTAGGGNGTGGNARISADSAGKSITLASGAKLDAAGFGGPSVNGRGGDGIGGQALLLANGGGAIMLPGTSFLTELDASGGGGNAAGSGDGGNGSSGIARVFVDGGNVSIDGDLDIISQASGGNGVNGGNAISVRPSRQPRTLIGSFNGTVAVNGNTFLTSAAFGGDGTNGGRGGIAFAGDAAIDAQSNNGPSSIRLNTLQVETAGLGGAGGAGGTGQAGGQGGDGYGGIASASGNAGRGELTVAGDTTIFASALGGLGGVGGTGSTGAAGGAGGRAIGGGISIGTVSGVDTPSNTGFATFANVTGDASAAGGDGGAGGSGTVQGIGGAGGTGFGGFAGILVRGSPATFSDVVFDASGLGGNGGAGSTQGNGGNGYGGDTNITVTQRFNRIERGLLTANNLTFISDAIGGTGATLGGSFYSASEGAETGFFIRQSDVNIGNFTLTYGGTLAPNVTASILLVIDPMVSGVPTLTPVTVNADPFDITLTQANINVSGALSITTPGDMRISLDTSTVNVGNLTLAAGNFVLPIARPASLGTFNVSGMLSLASLRDVVAYANFNGAANGFVSANGSVLTGDLTFGGLVDITASGSINTGNIRASDVALGAGAALATGAIVSTGDIDMVAVGGITTGQLTASDSVTAVAGGAINIAGASAGIVNTSTDPSASYTVALRSLTSITTGNLSARASVGLSTPGAIVVGNINAGLHVLGLAGTGITTGSITTPQSGTSTPQTYLANFSMEALGGQVGATFNPLPIFQAATLAPVAGSIAIGGPVTTGSFRAGAAGSVTVSGPIVTGITTSLSGVTGVSTGSMTAGQLAVLTSSAGAVGGGAVTAGDSVIITGATGVTLGNVSAGIVNLSTNPNANLKIAIASGGGSVGIGTLTARRDIGVQASQALSTGAISGRDILLLAGTSVTTGGIQAGSITQPTGRIVTANSSMTTPTINVFSNFANVPFFNSTLVPTGGPIIINGAVTSGSFKAATSKDFTGQGILGGVTQQSGDLIVDAGGLVTVNGLWRSANLEVVASDIAITATGSLDSGALGELSLASRNSSGAFIGDGLMGSGFNLSSAEFAKLSAGDIKIVGYDMSGLDTDMTIGNLTISGSQLYGAGGVVTFGTGNPVTETPSGILRINGAVSGAGFTPTTEIDLISGTVELDASIGSLKVSGGGSDTGSTTQSGSTSSGSVGGFIYVEADHIHVASDAILTKLRADPLYTGHIQELNAPATVQRPDGVFNALGFEIRPGQTFYIQNTGSRIVPAGFLTTLEASDVFAPKQPPTGGIEVVINGQFQTATGTVTGKAAYDRVAADPTPDSEQFFGFSSTSQLNGCVFLGGGCALGGNTQMAPPASELSVIISSMLTASPAAPGVVDRGPGDSSAAASETEAFEAVRNEDEKKDEEGDGNSGGRDDGDCRVSDGSSQISSPAALICARALNRDIIVIEPVSGAGNSALFGAVVNETPASGDKP